MFMQRVLLLQNNKKSDNPCEFSVMLKFWYFQKTACTSVVFRQIMEQFEFLQVAFISPCSMALQLLDTRYSLLKISHFEEFLKRS